MSTPASHGTHQYFCVNSQPSLLLKLEAKGAGCQALEDKGSAPGTGGYPQGQVDLTGLVAPVTSKLMDSIQTPQEQDSFMEEEGHTVWLPAPVEVSLAQEESEENTEGAGGQQRKTWEAAARLSGKQAAFSLKQDLGASQKSVCPGMLCQLCFSTKIFPPSWLARNSFRGWVSGHWLSRGCF